MNPTSVNNTQSSTSNANLAPIKLGENKSINGAIDRLTRNRENNIGEWENHTHDQWENWNGNQ